MRKTTPGQGALLRATKAWITVFGQGPQIINGPDPALVAALHQAFPNAGNIEYRGCGTFGVTYQVVEPTGSTVVKVLRPYCNVARTEREIENLSAVTSTHVCRFIDEGRFQFQGHALRYLRTEYLDGSTLRARLAAGVLQGQELIRLCRHMARGLQALHAVGLIHRDLKPENIMLDGTRFVAIDLGLSRRDGAPSLTAANDFLGTCQYSSLEQLLSSRHVDIRSDLFSLGMTLYEAANGSAVLPYHAGRPQGRVECMNNLRHVPLPSLHSMGRMAPIVEHLLQIHAHRRTNSPQALIEELARI